MLNLFFTSFIVYNLFTFLVKHFLWNIKTWHFLESKFCCHFSKEKDVFKLDFIFNYVIAKCALEYDRLWNMNSLYIVYLSKNTI